ncbi:alpha/beta hydrolase [Christiangramia echinicola]|uniref:Predicted hydrolase of the alpha/beta superfamily n=1 Tax=Christiangramia echinicola TaxID=279359 RepID=A0A1H1M416_9FLAO|nr:alpha/beta hydrolase-fold protein [Christiangramia echinicola]SDR81543.1 Predicted hydrolase of the alpha/beta superfamily [Christiangramia echinicola]
MKIQFSFFLLLICSLTINAQDPIPKASQGKIERIQNFESNYVSNRNIDVWLPETYNPKFKYAVLYMHDGQMLYDAKSTWNKQAWDVDSAASELIDSGSIKDFIIVGIWNGGSTRHSEYFPQKPYESLSETERDTVSKQLQNSHVPVNDLFKPQSDNYLKFIVEELKPFIDQKYSVLSDLNNTFIAGSSMGGLISMYAICEYPNIFGGAACLSTHWTGTFTLYNNPVPQSFLDYLDQNLPNSKNHKIYFDTGDQSLDSLYPNIQRKVDIILEKNGFGDNNWITEYFPGENHSENAWSKRIHIPLEFLLHK